MTHRAARLPRLRRSRRTRPPSSGTTGASTTRRPWPRRVERRYMLVPDHLLQLRGRLRPAGLRGQGHDAGPQVRGQPAPPGVARPQLRQGPGHHQPDQRPRADPLPAAARRARAAAGKWRRVTWDEVLDEIGGRIRKAFLEGRRNEVMYHVGRPGHERDDGPHPEGLGDRRPQLAHQRLLVLGAARLRALVRLRPAQPRPRERALHPAALRRTSSPATTSTRTRSGSSRASWRARSSR